MRKRQKTRLNQLRTKRSGVRVPPGAPRRGEPLWFAAFFCAKCGFTVRVGLTCRFGRCWTRPTGAQHRSSPRKVTLGSAARLQAPSLTPRCRYQLFAVEGHCSLGIYFVTLTHDGVTKLMSLHFCLISSGFQPFFENDSHTTLTVDVQGTLRLKAGLPPGFSRQEAPFFCFLPVFPSEAA